MSKRIFVAGHRRMVGSALIKQLSANPAEFIYDNLILECNVVHQAWKASVQKFLFLGSSCIYHGLATQLLQESELLTGALAPTNEPYALAKKMISCRFSKCT
jgi:GDP-L-fucose synthase